MRGFLFYLVVYLVVDSPTPFVCGLVGFFSVVRFELPTVPRSMVPDDFMPDAPVPAGCSPGPGVPAGPFMLEPVPIEPGVEPADPELCASAKVLVNASAPASAIVESFMVVSFQLERRINRPIGHMFRRR
jgi:hypothetical protein